MNDQHRLREVLERNARAVSLRPSVGQFTGRTKVRLKPGLECEIEDGAWRLTVGIGEKGGGSNAGPNPGTFGYIAAGMPRSYAPRPRSGQARIPAIQPSRFPAPAHW